MTAQITAAMVKELREATQAGIMDAKRALQETEGDFDEAVKILRERGMASAAKRAGRETSEGIVLTETDEHTASIVAVACETEPVSKNTDFLAFARDVLRTVHEHGESAVEGLEDRRVELSGKLGENIQVAGATRMRADHGEKFTTYVHPPANKIGALLKYRNGSPELHRELAMHIAHGRPTFRSRDEVPAELVQAEREILSNRDDVLSKPENLREKIVEGMLNKRFFAAQVLNEQLWIHDTTKTVGQALADAGAEALEFERFALAG